MSEPKTMMINDIEYVRKQDVKKLAEDVDGMKYCVIRTYWLR